MTATAPTRVQRTHGISPQGPAPVSPLAAPTLFGALAVIGGATALSPLIFGASWLLPIVEVVAVIWLVGVGARLAGAPSLLVSLLQVVAFLFSVTGLQLHSGIGGFVPGPAAVDEAAEALRAAWIQIMTTLPPTPATAEITLFVTIAIGALALLGDQLIAGAKAPALVGLPLLGLYSVPAAIAPEILPWYAFVLPAASFVGVLATAPSRFGRRGNTRTTVSLVVMSVVIAIAAIGAAITVSDAATTIGTEGRLPHSGRSAGQIGLSPWARLRGQLEDTDPVDIARVVGLTTPTYLRTFALEKWEPGTGFALGAVTASSHNIAGSLPGAAADSSTSETVTVTPQQYRDKYLPIYLNSSAVNGMGSGWDYDSTLNTVFRAAAATPAPYTVTSDTAVVTEAQLREDSVTGHRDLTEAEDVPAQVTQLAKQLVSGATTAFDEVDALLNFFTDPSNGFTYSLATPLGNSGNALVDFLSNRTGYCEQYAAAMAIMLRAVGIPARVGIGFTQGDRQPDGSYQVTSTDAHAWVEVPFEKSGWVIFDPTPAVDGQGGLQGFTPGAKGDTGPTTSPTTSTGAPSTGTSAPATATSGQQNTATTVTTTAAAASSGSDGNTDWGLLAWWTALILAIGAALAYAIAAPVLLRRLQRRRRLARAASGDDDSAPEAWQEVVDTAVDHGIAIGFADSVRTIANNVSREAALSERARTGLRDIVTSIEVQWYGVDLDLAGTNAAAPAMPAQAPAVKQEDFASAVRAVINGLQHERPLTRGSRWWPRSLRINNW